MTDSMFGSLTTMHALMGAHTLADDERAGVRGRDVRRLPGLG